MVRFVGLPLALTTLLFGALAYADAPAKPHASKPPTTKRPATAMHAMAVHVPDRPHALPNATPAIAKPDAKKPDAKAKPPCLRDPIVIMRGTEEDRFSLTRCDGSVAPESTAHLSILARPGSALKPSAPIATLDKVQGSELAPGIKRLDSRLVVRLQQIADHFQKPSASPTKLWVVSGYRPASVGSFHATGRALDFRMDGVTNESLVAFCRTLPETGCGFYPNSSFVHLDVRDAGAGHVTWIDSSGPGESARYVAVWPPPPMPMAPVVNAMLDKLLPPLPIDEHPADVASMPKTEASNDDIPMPEDMR